MKSIGSDKELNELFNQLLSIGDNVNPNICYPKYLNLELNIKNYLQLLKFFCRIDIGQYCADFATARDKLNKYIAESEKLIGELFELKFSEKIIDYSLLPKEDIKKFAGVYNKAKENKILADMFKICQILIPYKCHLDNKDPQRGFIYSIVGDFRILPMIDLDFKNVITRLDAAKEGSLAQGDTAEAKKAEEAISVIMLFMKRLKEICKKAVDIYTEPDVDVNEIVDLIMDKIDLLQRHVPRCRKAFNKIKESTKMLKENFNVYYMDFLESKRKNMILENFISDVAQSVGQDDINLAREFKEIISFITSNSNVALNNPKVSKVADLANSLLDQVISSDNIMEEKRAEKDEYVRQMRERDKAYKAASAAKNGGAKS